MSDRQAEIIEAVQLLHSLGKPVELIGSQLDLTAVEVTAIVQTGRIPATQPTLFPDSIAIKKEKPVSRLAPWKQALAK